MGSVAVAGVTAGREPVGGAVGLVVEAVIRDDPWFGSAGGGLAAVRPSQQNKFQLKPFSCCEVYPTLISSKRSLKPCVRFQRGQEGTAGTLTQRKWR